MMRPAAELRPGDPVWLRGEPSSVSEVRDMGGGLVVVVYSLDRYGEVHQTIPLPGDVGVELRGEQLCLGA